MTADAAATSGDGEGGSAAADAPHSPAQMVWLKFAVWLLLTVLVGLSPTIAEWLHGRQTRGATQRDFWEWCSRAQLYPMAMTMAIASIGEALMQLLKKASALLVLLTVNNLVIIVFSAIMTPSSGDENANLTTLGQQSLIMFGVAVAGAGLCTWMCAKAAESEGSTG
ncbi:hypothetical protein [Streptomyces sp. NPDC048252]|uniref:hypothetical protein n=1 Tax=Streptomyces sp. NPDC048252 TaxID=3154612 RepID=UPI0034157865